MLKLRLEENHCPKRILAEVVGQVATNDYHVEGVYRSLALSPA